MAVCYICSCDKPDGKMAKPVAGKNICKCCYLYLGRSWSSAEKEVEAMVEFDQAAQADPHFAGRI